MLEGISIEHGQDSNFVEQSLSGTIKPRRSDSTVTALGHRDGNTDSHLTSWTTDFETALRFADGPEGGLLFCANIPEQFSECCENIAEIDPFKEQEVLVNRTVKNALVFHVSSSLDGHNAFTKSITVHGHDVFVTPTDRSMQKHLKELDEYWLAKSPNYQQKPYSSPSDDSFIDLELGLIRV